MNNSRILLVLAVAGCLAAALLASDAASRELLGNSLQLAAGACSIAVPLGTLLALMLARTDVAARRLGAAALGLLLFLPLFVQLSGWDALLGKLGWLTLQTGAISDPWLSGMRGAVWVHGMASVPWAAVIVSLGLLQAEPQLEEAALLDAAPLNVLWHVTLVRAWPFVLAAAAWTAVSTTVEMSVTNIYLVNTYTEQLYNSFALNSEPLEIGWRIWPGMLLLATLGGGTLALLRGLAKSADAAALSERVVFHLGRWRLPVSLALWSLVAMLIVSPVASLVTKAGMLFERTMTGQPQQRWSAARTLEVLGEAPQRFAFEFAWSFAMAVSAATAALLLALGLTWFGRRGGWRLAPLALLLALGLAIPGPLVASSLIWLLNREAIPGFVWLYDRTIFAPTLAQAIRALPAALLICWPALTSVDRRMLEAAELDGAGPWSQLRLIALPARWRAVAAAWLVAVAVALGDLSYSLLVIPPGMDTIQRRIFGLMHAGVDEQVAAACLLLIGVYALLATAVWLGLRGNKFV